MNFSVSTHVSSSSSSSHYPPLDSISNTSLSSVQGIFANAMSSRIFASDRIYNLLSNVCLGSSQKDTGYEGIEPHESIDLYTCMLKTGPYFFFSPDEVNLLRKNLEEVIFKPGHSSQMQGYLEKIKKRIESLQKDHHFLIESGWKGAPQSHAMLISISKKEEDYFDLKIYNGQSAYYQGGWINGRKEKTHPFLLFKDVTASELWVSDGSLFENLCNAGEGYDRFDFKQYREILPYSIRKKMASVDPASELFISIQRSGNCPVKSLHCYLLSALGDHHLYKRLTLNMRLNFILSFYGSLKQKTKKDKIMLTNAARSFLRNLEKNHRIGIIEDEPFLKAFGIIKNLINDLKTEDSFVLIPEHSCIEENTSVKVPLREIKTEKKQKNCDVISFNLRGEEPIEWNSLLSIFKEVEKLKENPSQYCLQMEFLSYRLRTLKYSRCVLDYQSAIVLLDNIPVLLDPYCRAMDASDKLSSLSLKVVCMELMALAYTVAVQLDPTGSISKYSPCIKEMQSPVDSFVPFQNPRLLKHYHEILYFYRQFSQEPSSQLFHFTDTYKIPTDANGDYIGEACLYHSLGFSSKEIEALFFSVTPSWKENPTDICKAKDLVLFLKRCAMSAFGCVPSYKEGGHHFYEIHPGRVRGEVFVYSTCYKTWSADRNPKNSSFDAFCSKIYLETLKNNFFFTGLSSRADFENENNMLCEVQNNLKLNEINKALRAKWFTPLSQSNVQTAALIDRAKEQIEDLLEKQIRLFWEHSIFRLNEKLQAPILNAVETDHEILTHAQQLTISAFEKFSLNDETSWLALLSVLRVVSTLVGLSNQKNKGYEIAKSIKNTIMTELLEKNPPTEEPLLNQLYSIKVMLLAGFQEGDRTYKESAELLQAAFEVNQNYTNKRNNSENHLFECSAHRFYSESFVSYPNTEEFVQELSKLVPLGFDKNHPIHRQMNKDGLILSQGNFVCFIDFSLPTIVNSLGKLEGGRAEFVSGVKFSRILGAPSTTPKKVGDSIIFEDSILGSVRVQGSQCERNIGGEWYTYCFNHENKTSESPFYNVIPKELVPFRAILHDYSFWRNNENLNDCKICDLKTGEIWFQTNSKGEIETCDHQWIVVKIDPKEMVHFDEDYYCLKGQGPNHQGEYRLIFNLFKHYKEKRDGAQGLIFFANEEDTRWRLKEHPEYCVDHSISKFFEIKNSLGLIKEDGSKKLLVPVNRIYASGFESYVTIRDASFLYRETNSKPYRASLSYMIFDVSPEGKLTAQTLDEKIYLTHLLLARKQYQLALDVIKSISFNDGRTEWSDLFILFFWRDTESLQDASPSAIAVRLWLNYTIKNKILPFLSDRDSLDQSFERFTSRFYKVYLESYLKGIQELEEGLELSPEALKILKIEPKNESQKILIRAKEVQEKITTSPFWTQKNQLFNDPKFKKLDSIFQNLKRSLTEEAINSAAFEVHYLATHYPDCKYDLYLLLEAAKKNEFSKETFPINYTSLFNRLRNRMKEIEIPKVETETIVKEMPEEISSEASFQCDGTPPFFQVFSSANSIPLSFRESIDTFIDFSHNVFPHLEMEEGEKTEIKHWNKYIESRNRAAKKDAEKISIKQEKIEELREYLLENKNQTATRLKALEENIQFLLDKPAINSALAIAQKESKQIGWIHRKLSMTALCRIAVLSKESDELALMHDLNPDLFYQERKQLRQLLISFMIQKTDLKHIENILKTIEEANLDETAHLLLQEHAYDIAPTGYEPYLFFEYVNGIRLRPEQLETIRTVRESLIKDQAGHVFQISPGGGKTSTILPQIAQFILTYTQNQKKIPIILAHYSQISSLKGSLKHIFESSFNKDLMIIEHSSYELNNLDCLTALHSQIEYASENRLPVLMPASLPQQLELKWIITCKNSSRLDQSRIILMGKILHQIKENGIALIDECDLSLSTMTEVNIPVGKTKQLPPEESELLGEIYAALLDKEVKDLVKLADNEQKNMTLEVYKKKVVPHLAQRIFRLKNLRLSHFEEFLDPFTRYIQDEITEEEQEIANQGSYIEHLDEKQQANIRFLRYLDAVWNQKDQDKYDHIAINLIALCRHLISSVLPLALSKTFDRHYGLDQEKRDGSMIPYQGVGNPSKTQFGYVYLSLALHLQGTLNGKIEEKQLKLLGQKLWEAGLVFSKKEKVDLRDTAESRIFEELTNGCTFQNLADENKLREALAYLNNPEHPKRRLKFALELTPVLVKYFPEHVRSSSIDFAWQFNSKIACSGTPWNCSTYHDTFPIPHLDQETEGRVLNKIAEKTSNPDCYKVNEESISAMIQLIKAHPSKEKIKAIIDTGAYLKEDLRKTANEILNELIHIQGVIFLEKEELNQFVILKRGGYVTCLKNTSKEEVLKSEISLDQMFVIYDEARTTGTDIPLAEDAVCLQTIDHKMPIRSLIQGAARARQLNKNQKIDLVLSKSVSDNFTSFSLEDIYKSLSENEAQGIQKETLQSFVLKIHHVIRSQVIQEMLAARENTERLSEIVKDNADVLMSKTIITPKETWGQIPRNVIAKDALKSICRLKIEDQAQQQQLCEKIDSCTYLPEKIPFRNNFKEQIELEMDQDQSVEIEVVAQVETDRENHQEVIAEVRQELNLYQNHDGSSPYREEKLSSDVWLKNSSEQIVRVSDFLSDERTIKPMNQQNKYAVCFPPSLWITDNLRYTFERKEIASPFHMCAKESDYILVRHNAKANEELEFVLLSLRDAKQLKKEFQKKPPKNSCLISMSGIFEVKPDSHLEEKLKERVVEWNIGLYAANLYRGHINYLKKQEKPPKYFQSNWKLCQRYAILKHAFKPESLFKNVVQDILCISKNPLTKSPLLLCSLRREQIAAKYLLIRELSEEEVAILKKQEVQSLKSHQIGWLKNPKQINALKPAQLIFLKKSQLDLIQPKNVNFLSNEQIPLLDKAEQIEALKDKKVFYTTADQRSKTSPEWQENFLTLLDKMIGNQKECQSFIKMKKNLSVLQLLKERAETIISQNQEIPLCKEIIEILDIDILMNASPEIHQAMSEQQIEKIANRLKDEEPLPSTIVQRLPLSKLVEANRQDLAPSLSAAQISQFKGLEHASFLQALKQEQVEYLSGLPMLCTTKEQRSRTSDRWKNNFNDFLNKTLNDRAICQQLIGSNHPVIQLLKKQAETNLSQNKEIPLCKEIIEILDIDILMNASPEIHQAMSEQQLEKIANRLKEEAPLPSTLVQRLSLSKLVEANRQDLAPFLSAAQISQFKGLEHASFLRALKPEQVEYLSGLPMLCTTKEQRSRTSDRWKNNFNDFLNKTLNDRAICQQLIGSNHPVIQLLKKQAETNLSQNKEIPLCKEIIEILDVDILMNASPEIHQAMSEQQIEKIANRLKEEAPLPSTLVQRLPLSRLVEAGRQDLAPALSTTQISQFKGLEHASFLQSLKQEQVEYLSGLPMLCTTKEQRSQTSDRWKKDFNDLLNKTLHDGAICQRMIDLNHPALIHLEEQAGAIIAQNENIAVCKEIIQKLDLQKIIEAHPIHPPSLPLRVFQTLFAPVYVTVAFSFALIFNTVCLSFFALATILRFNSQKQRLKQEFRLCALQLMHILNYATAGINPEGYRKRSIKYRWNKALWNEKTIKIIS